MVQNVAHDEASENFPQDLGDFQTKGHHHFAEYGVQIEIVGELWVFLCVTVQWGIVHCVYSLLLTLEYTELSSGRIPS